MRIPGLESPIAATGLVLAGLALGAAVPAAAQDWQGPAAFALRVTDEEGEPIATARVLAQPSEAGATGGPEAVTTDGLGQAVLSGLREGEWYVEVSHPSYMLYAAYLELRAGKKPQVGFSSQVNTETSWQPMTVKFLKASPDLRRGSTTRQRTEPEPPQVVREAPPEAAPQPEPPEVVRPEKAPASSSPTPTEGEDVEEEQAEAEEVLGEQVEAEEESAKPRRAESLEVPDEPEVPDQRTSGQRTGGQEASERETAEPADAERRVTAPATAEPPSERPAADAEPAAPTEPTAAPSAPETGVEETPTEESSAEQAPAVEAPTEETPTEKTPTEEAPAEGSVADQEPVEETPAEEIPVRELPAEATPIEPAVVEPAPAEETAGEQVSAGQAAAGAASGAEVPIDEAPLEPEPAERPQTPPAAPTAGEVMPDEPMASLPSEGGEAGQTAEPATGVEPAAETPEPAVAEPEALEPDEEATETADEEPAAAMPSTEPEMEARHATPPPPPPSTESSPPGGTGTPRLPAYLRSAAAGNCPECESGEWAVASEQEAGRAGELRSEQQCSEAFVDGAAHAVRLLADAPGARLADYVGPVLPAMWRLDPERRDEVEELLVPRTDPASHCQLAGVVLPSGAEFTGYVLEAWDVLGGRSCLAGFDCAVGQSRWLAEPVVLEGAERTVVYGIFKNRSTRRERRARMTIYFRPPSPGWRPASR